MKKPQSSSIPTPLRDWLDGVIRSEISGAKGKQISAKNPQAGVFNIAPLPLAPNSTSTIAKTKGKLK